MVVLVQILFQLCKFSYVYQHLNLFFLHVSSQNPDGTTSAILDISTSYLNFQNNATQTVLNTIGAVTTVLVNTSKRFPEKFFKSFFDLIRSCLCTMVYI